MMIEEVKRVQRDAYHAAAWRLEALKINKHPMNGEELTPAEATVMRGEIAAYTWTAVHLGGITGLDCNIEIR